MAEAAEQLLSDTNWLPPLLRTERPAMPALQEDRIADVEASAGREADSFEAQGWDEDPDHGHAEEDGMDVRPGFSEAAE
jgi:ParB family chromosome partitioning protein